ncbi:MAG TPA: hypothetical protein EYP04_05855 [Anaerolineae bacterium]|nr:hypothetical protein [Anaerolineae bacterium]
MNVLDENIPDSQRQLLRSWRIKVRQIGHEIGRRGMKDEEITPLLHQMGSVTFFTRDLGFYERSLCHSGYCLVSLAVGKNEAAFFVRRLLRHPEFDTKAKRMGTVIRISGIGLRV